MFDTRRSILLAKLHLLLLIGSPAIQSQIPQHYESVCAEGCFSANLQVHYSSVRSHGADLVWFTLENCRNSTFDFYRFFLRSIDAFAFSTVASEPLTNFTELIDCNNSLRMLDLNAGMYEVCIEFQINETQCIYRPREACVHIQIGEPLHGSYKQNPTSLLITLAGAIVLFFILGLVVQRVKSKRKKTEIDDVDKQRARSSSVLSMTSIKQQRDRLVRNMFHHHFDKPHTSALHQWARIRAFRHRISVQDQEVEKPHLLRRWSRIFITPADQSSQSRSRTSTSNSDRIPPSTTDQVYTISDKKSNQTLPRKISFYLTPPDTHEGV